ncbi:MAG TPA: Ig-like domain-containing protein [Candidatus Sulfotelmatobacter sp.]|nr:Ig-like domain-containing protein [Candidatus Sulfotelmatobacter sp.]
MRGQKTFGSTGRYTVTASVIAIGVVLSVWAGCSGLPKNVANCPVTPTPPANTSIVPPAAEPPPAALCGFPLSITSPANGASVSSPVPIIAAATPPDPIYIVRVYVDGLAVLYTPNQTVNQLIWMPDGQHTVEVVAEDTSGYIATTSMQLNVTSQEPGAMKIQDMPSWVSCSAVIGTNNTCAAGLGTAESTLTLDQATPSLDGSAAKFTLGGSHPYSNELYWTPLGGGASVSHFTYDLWFYIDNGNAPQSLEFDVNQAFGGTRWTWGSQCDFDDSHQWNIWDPLNGVWRDTGIPCNHFPSQTWIHLIWHLERVGNQVHYISLDVDNQSYTVDTYYTAQPNWYQEEIDVAFQMDGNWEQQPYTVWLDEVNLLAN